MDNQPLNVKSICRIKKKRFGGFEWFNVGLIGSLRWIKPKSSLAGPIQFLKTL